MKRQSVRRPLRTGKNGAAFALLVLIALPHAMIFLPGCGFSRQAVLQVEKSKKRHERADKGSQ
jgi:hypothetical protein